MLTTALIINSFFAREMLVAFLMSLGGLFHILVAFLAIFLWLQWIWRLASIFYWYLVPEAGQTTFSRLFSTFFVHLKLFSVISCLKKGSENEQKKSFDQLLGARNTQIHKLEIHYNFIICNECHVRKLENKKILNLT